jgi:hypothetical protein
LAARQIAANRCGKCNQSLGGQQAGDTQANGTAHAAAEQPKAVSGIDSAVNGLYGRHKVSAARLQGCHVLKFSLAAATTTMIESEKGDAQAVALFGQRNLFG